MSTGYHLPVPHAVPPHQQFRPVPARPQHVIVPLLNSLPAPLMTPQGTMIYGTVFKFVQKSDNGEWMGVYRFRHFDPAVGRYVVQDALFEVAWSGTKLKHRKTYPARLA